MVQYVSEISEEEIPKFKRKCVINGLKSPMSSKRMRQTDIIAKIEKKIRKTEDERCFKCKKRLLPYMQFSCRCGNKYCSLHRFFDKHDCSFDYKKETLKKLTKENPKVAFDKISRI